MADSYIEVTNEDFAEKVLNSSLLAIVNFSAAQSSPCQILEPEFIAASKEYQERVLFAKADVDKQQELTKQWNVDGIPTLIFFSGGKEIYRIKGIMMREKLKRQIEGVLLAT